MMMVTVAADNSSRSIEDDSVWRVRETVTAEASRGAKTRIDFAESFLLVLETPDALGQAIHQNVPHFVSLHAPDGVLVWFKGEDSAGPDSFNADIAPDGTHGALTIHGQVQYVTETVEQVRTVVMDNGGQPGDL